MQSQWHKTASSAQLAKMNKDEIRRQEATYELIQSEENYVQDLELVVRVRSPRPASSLRPRRLPARPIPTLFSSTIARYSCS